MERIATARFSRMAKKLLTLIAVLAAMLAAAVPALAQQEVVITGVLYQEQGGYYTVVDEAGQDRLLSDEGAGLRAYVGEEVTLYGTPSGDVPESFAPFFASPLLNITRVEPTDSPQPPGPSLEKTATFDFRLAVEGKPPAEGCISVPLSDPDGDGLYTGSLDVPRFPPGPTPLPDAEPVALPVQIVHTDGGASPCDPTEVIRDFGTVPANDDTFKSSVEFDEGRGGPTPPEDSTVPGNDGDSEGDSGDDSGSGGSDAASGSSDGGGFGGGPDSGSSGSGNSGGSEVSDSGGSGNDAASRGSPGNATDGIRGVLPSTGGSMALTLVGAGVLMTGVGLLVRRLAR